jgi:hypothetical protein
MFRSTEASVLCNKLSTMATYDHVNSTLSSTRLHSIGRCRKPREPSRRSPDTPGHTAPGDPGVGAASPGATLPGTTKSDPRITKSRSESLVLSLG